MPKTLSTSTVDPKLGVHIADGDKYYFYHKKSFAHSPPQIYQSLIGRSTQEVCIWDPYFNITKGNRDQDIFVNIGQDITIRILTLKGLFPLSTYFNDIANEIKLIVPSAKNTRLAMRAINTGNSLQADWHFHDRFLIIDQQQIYIVGASLGWHIQVRYSTGIYHITDIETQVFIRSMFDEYWARATDFQYTLRYLHT